MARPASAVSGQGVLFMAETLLWPSNWAKVGLPVRGRIALPQICRDMPQRARLELASGIMLMCADAGHASGKWDAVVLALQPASLSLPSSTTGTR